MSLENCVAAVIAAAERLYDEAEAIPKGASTEQWLAFCRAVLDLRAARENA